MEYIEINIPKDYIEEVKENNMDFKIADDYCEWLLNRKEN